MAMVLGKIIECIFGGESSIAECLNLKISVDYDEITGASIEMVIQNGRHNWDIKAPPLFFINATQILHRQVKRSKALIAQLCLPF